MARNFHDGGEAIVEAFRNMAQQPSFDYHLKTGDRGTYFTRQSSGRIK